MSLHRLSWVVVALTCAGVGDVSVAADRLARTEATSLNSTDVERGRYLVMITGCNDCHTPNFLANARTTPEKDRLTGGKLGWRGPWGTAYAVNLRLYFQDMTVEQWILSAKEIQQRPPMPYFSLNAMTTPDLKAIYEYIRHLGPAGDPAPEFVAPDRDPSQPYVLFPIAEEK